MPNNAMPNSAPLSLRAFSVVAFALACAGCDFRPRQISELSERDRYEPILARIDRAEAIADPVERCIATPSPPHLAWPEAMIEAFCRDQFTPVAQAETVRGMIDRSDWDGLRAHYDGYLKRHLSAQDPELLLYRAFPAHSWRSAEEAERYTLRWLKARPDDPYANTLRARQLVAEAWRVRGGGFASAVPAVKMQRTAQLAREAAILALKAAKTQPKLMPAYQTLIEAYMLSDQPDSMRRTLAVAVAESPANYYVRGEAAHYMRLMWGGSYAELDVLAEAARPHFGDNPRLRMLAGGAKADLAQVRSQGEHPGRALAAARESLEAGPKLSTLSHAAELSDKIGYESETLMYLTQYIRFERDRKWALLYRAGIFEMGPWYDRALRDYRAALAFEPGDAKVQAHIARVEAAMRGRAAAAAK